jgi:hypothetical protein
MKINLSPTVIFLNNCTLFIYNHATTHFNTTTMIYKWNHEKCNPIQPRRRLASSIRANLYRDPDFLLLQQDAVTDQDHPI